MHPPHNTQPTYGWILKGEEKAIPTNSGRDRVNQNGALNLTDQSVVTNEEERLNAESFIRLLKQLEEKQANLTKSHPGGGSG